MSQIVVYGYKRTLAELETLGGDVIYSDRNKERFEREEMLKRGIRAGDIVRVIHIRDLGGSPKADALMVKIIMDDLGATIDVRAPKKQQGKGRPRKFDPPADKNAEIRELWLDGTVTEDQRIKRIKHEFGLDVKRGALFKRYGSPTTPKPLVPKPEKE